MCYNIFAPALMAGISILKLLFNIQKVKRATQLVFRIAGNRSRFPLFPYNRVPIPLEYSVNSPPSSK